MEEYNKLVNRVRKLRVVESVGKSMVHRDYLIDLYTLLVPPLDPKYLVSVIFSDKEVQSDHVNLVSGKLVINGMQYSLDSRLLEAMKVFRDFMRKRKEYNPEYIFSTPSGNKYTTNNANMYFRKIFGISITAYKELYAKRLLEELSLPDVPNVVPVQGVFVTSLVSVVSNVEVSQVESVPSDSQLESVSSNVVVFPVESVPSDVLVTQEEFVSSNVSLEMESELKRVKPVIKPIKKIVKCMNEVKK